MTDDMTDDDSFSKSAPSTLPPFTKKSADHLTCSSYSIVTRVKNCCKQSPLPLNKRINKQTVSFNPSLEMFCYGTRSRTQNGKTKRSASSSTKQLSKKAKSTSVVVDAASTKSGMYYILYSTSTFYILCYIFLKIITFSFKSYNF